MITISCERVMCERGGRELADQFTCRGHTRTHHRHSPHRGTPSRTDPLPPINTVICVHVVMYSLACVLLITQLCIYARERLREVLLTHRRSAHRWQRTGLIPAARCPIMLGAGYRESRGTLGGGGGTYPNPHVGGVITAVLLGPIKINTGKLTKMVKRHRGNQDARTWHRSISVAVAAHLVRLAGRWCS